MKRTIGKATRQAAQQFGGPFTSAQIAHLVASQFPEELPEWIALKVQEAIGTQRKTGKIQTVKAGSPKEPGLYRWNNIDETKAA